MYAYVCMHALEFVVISACWLVGWLVGWLFSATNDQSDEEWGWDDDDSGVGAGGGEVELSTSTSRAGMSLKGNSAASAYDILQAQPLQGEDVTQVWGQPIVEVNDGENEFNFE